MANPTRGSWKRMKKVVRYLIDREKIIWDFNWQDEITNCYIASDSDWGGKSKR